MTLSHVTKGVSVTWRWCYYLPVDGREMVSPSVSIQGWGLTVNVDRLCHAPLEPLGFLVQNRHFVGGEWVICLGQMFPNRGRRSFMVFCDPVLELSSRLTYIGSRALSTLDAIDEHMLRIKFESTSCEIPLRWMSQNTFDDKSTLVQVMAWCRQATSHYLLPKSLLTQIYITTCIH